MTTFEVVRLFCRRSLDVLDLIGRVLNFTEEQKIAVGLKPPQINIVSSLYKTILGAPPKPVAVDVSMNYHKSNFGLYSCLLLSLMNSCPVGVYVRALEASSHIS